MQPAQERLTIYGEDAGKLLTEARRLIPSQLSWIAQTIKRSRAGAAGSGHGPGLRRRRAAHRAAFPRSPRPKRRGSHPLPRPHLDHRLRRRARAASQVFRRCAADLHAAGRRPRVGTRLCDARRHRKRFRPVSLRAFLSGRHRSNQTAVPGVAPSPLSSVSHGSPAVPPAAA